MELKPIKERKEALYPTIKEVPKSNYMKEILLAAAIAIDPKQMVDLYVAVPCYVAVASNIFPIKICKLIRNISIIITILSTILLFINKMKINKCTAENGMEENLKKLNKHRKIKWWIFGISIAILVITSIVIYYLENYM